MGLIVSLVRIVVCAPFLLITLLCMGTCQFVMGKKNSEQFMKLLTRRLIAAGWDEE